ncbi:LysR family transcriptional regulator [Microbacterium jiangjiandongii]|uniref:LysR family transcriptional regulator n=1 Tax=Microbacterium jiangjiandongii TaxID=3049071 RepID=UPI00214C44B0|nr:LysR family transcriptional regulator [Microbacterium sp. zg.Y843]MCR2815010.1 LysR family transcriptional regulator [Microbacterium sp. zg.Y843]
MASLSRLDGYRFEWLTSFLAVVDFGGFASAAEGTFRSQPRISSHVADLERHIGADLFDRRQRPVRLTDAGIAFLEHARAVTRSLEAAADSVQAVLGVLRGTVRLGWYPSAGAAFGPTVLKEFSDRYPHIKVTIVEGDAAALGDALRAGDIDLAIRPQLPQIKEPSVRSHALWEEPLVAVVPEGHPIALNEYVSVAEVASYRVITTGIRGAEAESTNEAYRAFKTARVTPHVVHHSDLPQTLISLARAGIGVGLTNMLAAEISERAGTRIVPIQDSGNRQVVRVFWDSARPLQPATRALLDLVTQLPVPEPVKRYQRGGV